MYAESGLKLEDLCDPVVLKKDDELFYGFWGQALNRSQRSKQSSSNAIKSIHHWKEVFFLQNDPRFQVEDKSKKKDENPPQEDKKKFMNMPSRFFCVTSSIDGELVKEGFKESEYYETRGDLLTWQCAIPCCKSFFRVKEDFRFEINQESGRAPPLKFQDKHHHTKKGEDGFSDSLFTSVSEEDFNFYSATGKTDYFKKKLYMDTPISGAVFHKGNSDKLIPTQIGEKRGAFYQFFSNKDVPEKFKNPENYQRPGSASRRVSSLYGKNNYVLGSLADIGKIAEQTSEGIKSGLNSRSLIERRDAVLQRYNLINTEDENNEEYNTDIHNNGIHLHNVNNNLKLLIENKSGDESRFQEFSEDVHVTLHSFAVNGEIDPSEEGYMEVTIIDPMIHYHQFYTDIHNSDDIVTERDIQEFRKNPVPIIPKDFTLVAGSTNVKFIISVQIYNLEDTIDEPFPVISFTSQVSPTIRRKREEDGIFVDSVIINAQDTLSNKVLKNMPVRGKVSVVVQPLLRKNTLITRVEEKPWQLVGEYNMRFLLGTPVKKSNLAQRPRTEGSLRRPHSQLPDISVASVRMLDFSLKTRDSVHSLKLRTIQEGDQGVKLGTVFVDMPISDFSTANPTIPVHQPEIKDDRKTASFFSASSSTNPTPSVTTPTVFNTPKSALASSPYEDPFNKKAMQYSDLLNSKVKSEEDIDLYNPKKQPVINRIFCESCRGVARPRAKMNATDEQWIKTSMIPFRTWTTKIKKAIQEEGRSLCILEIGAEQKLRTMSDTVLKQNSGAELIRINPKLRMVRGQKEVLKIPQGAEGQINIIEDPSASAAIKKIDQFLTEISERFNTRM
ncbi:predicted protein [Naegleria gruberi]|uniref:Predicted protein n=1 Tax=Naegleria gruberi TaxID=5762 RepID=D2UY44_NAEGR|nr:uncharacterized protein NAEGRDRAFT_61340 [Naegleria gruberi]EFC50729.1 predicted protein [Naegleria gruberi]|eukprot:XP_002683473.1 predicted protein [Naegleria gruberi strain NEG-M]